MEISPLDVRSQAFRRKFKGCDPDEVKQFLDAVADRMEAMLKAKEDLERENTSLRDRNEAYAKMEQTLRDTLLTAQKVSADARANAHQAAENVIKEAEVEAKRRLAAASGQVDAIANDREMLKAETMALVAKLKSLIEAQLTFIGSMEDDIRRQGTQTGQTGQTAQGAHAAKAAHGAGSSH
ncbi:MAG: DivIVA domain-containing protein [bacterium]